VVVYHICLKGHDIDKDGKRRHRSEREKERGNERKATTYSRKKKEREVGEKDSRRFRERKVEVALLGR
jgi:hypothetical protein